MSLPRNHKVILTQADLIAMQESLKAFVEVLKIQTSSRLVAFEVQRAVDTAAKLSSRVQRHSADLCDCPYSTPGENP